MTIDEQLEDRRGWKDLNEENRIKLTAASSEESVHNLWQRVTIAWNEGRQNRLYEAKTIADVLERLYKGEITPEEYRIHLLARGAILKLPIKVYPLITLKEPVIGRPVFLNSWNGLTEHYDHILLFDNPNQYEKEPISHDRVLRDKEAYERSRSLFAAPHLKAYLDGPIPKRIRKKISTDRLPIHELRAVNNFVSSCVKIDNPVLLYDIPKVTRNAAGSPPEAFGNFYLVGCDGVKALWDSNQEVVWQLTQIKPS